MLNTYQDRGIIKWAAFDALNGFNPMLREMKHRLNKQQKPILSEDDFEEMNRTMKLAILDSLEIMLVYFEHGYSKVTYGKINKLDFNDKKIILSTRERISAFDILKIEIV